MDETGFERLYSDTWRDILGYALRRTQNQADAADLVAEVFAVAWRRRADIPTGLSGRLWLYGVARLTLANQRRGELRRSNLAVALREAMVFHAVDPATVAIARDESAAIHAALRRLSDVDRELLTLVAWDGLTPAQAAAILGLTTVTARVRLHRARKRLREILEEPVQRKASSGHVLGNGRLPVTAEESS